MKNLVEKNVVKTFCDGAAMAYHDCAVIMRNMILNAPPELREIMSALEPVAASFEYKGNTVHKQAEVFLSLISGKPQ